MVPYTSLNLFIISATGACGPRYQTRSAGLLHKDCTIPSLNVTSVWLWITLFTSKAQYSKETSLFWMVSLLNVLNFGILPTTWEATLGQEILHCGSGICLCNCMFVPSTNVLSLTTQHNQSPSSPAHVWQQSIQYLHCDPTTSQLIAICYKFFQCLHLPRRLTECSFHQVFVLPLALPSYAIH